MTKAFHIVGMITIAIFLSLSQASCSEHDPKVIKEPAMNEGMVITAQTKHGELIIRAGKDSIREYTWDNETIIADLWPRKERWYGNLGLYHAQLRPPHKGVVHMVVEEYQAHHKSTKEAVSEMNKFPDREDLYNDDGLHVRFIKQTSPEGETFVNVLVTQT